MDNREWLVLDTEFDLRYWTAGIALALVLTSLVAWLVETSSTEIALIHFGIAQGAFFIGWVHLVKEERGGSDE